MLTRRKHAADFTAYHLPIRRLPVRRPWNLLDTPCDPAAAGPPIPDLPGYEGIHTLRPRMANPRLVESDIRGLHSSRLRGFLHRQQSHTLRIRGALQRGERELRRIVGGENIMLSFPAREGVSTDSTGMRGMVTEALFLPPDVDSLQRLMRWCFRNRIPVIPYGAGSGYNMGVVPLAPAVTVWLGCLNTVEKPRPYRSSKGGAACAISAEAGALYAEVLSVAQDHGYVLRCVPNSPRAAVGGVVATGSNGGRRIGEVVIGGEAVLGDGTLVRFATSDEERSAWRSPFPLIHKFQGAPQETMQLRRMLRQGEVLPASLFVGAEGTTGVITRVELELERPSAFASTMAVWLAGLEDVPPFVRRVRASPAQPTYFELLTQPAIRHYLRPDFGDLFSGDEQAYIMLTFEDDHEPSLKDAVERVRSFLPSDGRWTACGPYPSRTPPSDARRLIAPREELPKRLVSKCKTDIEVVIDALPRVIPYLASATDLERNRVEAILFGHLTPAGSAILHWNIGGVDLAVEESAARGWQHIERTLEAVACPNHTTLEAVFTGEHGASGKPWLFHRAVPRDELARIYRVKRALDPLGILNPRKLFLPARISKAIRGRTLAQLPEVDKETRDVLARCTRCNACQECPVIDAQIALRSRRIPRQDGAVITGKRSLLHTLELTASARLDPEDRARLLGAASRSMEACFACGRCDKNCPADITLEEIAALLPNGIPRGTWRTDLLHLLFLAPAPRIGTMMAASVFQHLGGLVRRPAARVSHAAAGYVALPPVDWRRYASPGRSAPGISSHVVVVGNREEIVEDGEIVIRFRGCVGTVGQASASIHEDAFFRSTGLSFLDFTPDLCCGFPFAASGRPEKARQLRVELMTRIAEAVQSARTHWDFERATVVSSCPTCQESLRNAQRDLPGSFDHLAVADPAERIVRHIAGRPNRTPGPVQSVGLKVPCHATPWSVAAQESMLRIFGFEPVRFEQCCGMAGIGRLEHPEVGLAIGERLSEAIRRTGCQVVASGCPSCRDGLRLQSSLERSCLQVEDIYGLLVDAS